MNKFKLGRKIMFIVRMPVIFYQAEV